LQSSSIACSLPVCGALAHLLQRFGKAHVALHAVLAHAFHPHRPAAYCAGSEEIRG
jgi:hypothetical protein